MSVIQFQVKIAVMTLLVLTTTMVIIGAQSPDDHELRTFLTPPPECSEPCFMGIRPGRTSVAEAATLLKAHPWVLTIEIFSRKLPNVFGSDPGIVWMWSGEQPRWIDGSQQGSVTVESGIVSSIRFQSTIPLGEVQLLLGEPDSQRTSNTQMPSGQRFRSYAAIYPENRLWISIRARCPVRQPFDAFRQPVFLQWSYNSRASLNPSSPWSEVYGNC